METIRVNMTPCEDIKTIHASQNDNEAREWGFELHNNGDAIDASEITDQMVFKAYEGGTEQILPENGSVPTTSPFLGDIQYPQGLLTDQEFLYRESPTESDGLAKIQTIYGNTLKWNQLNNNSDDSRSRNGVSFTKNNDGSWTLSGTTTSNNTFMNINNLTMPLTYIKDHIYLFTGASSNCNIRLYANGVTKETFNSDAIFKADSTLSEIYTRWQIYPNTANVTVNETLFHMYFDLTEMFGQTKAEEILAMGQTDGIAYFRSLFPMPFYQYDSGSLLPFRGEGLKTVGFNQWDEEWENGRYNVTTGEAATEGGVRSKNFIKVLPNTAYFLACDSIASNDFRVLFYDGNKNYINANGWAYGNTSFTTRANAQYIKFFVTSGSYGVTYKNDICINISDPSKNGTYEPYWSSTLSLPISTYFPNGMNGVNDVHDELRNDGTSLKMNVVDLGSLNWTYVSANGGWFRAPMPSDAIGKIEGGRANNICPRYTTFVGSFPDFVATDKTILVSSSNISSSNLIALRDTSYTDATSLKNSLQNVPLCYELATPTETSFTTASLVTENAEIPLSAENDVLVGKCTEELSAEPGFYDAKIKLADEDGECYSNKIQLHIERKPQ